MNQSVASCVRRARQHKAWLEEAQAGGDATMVDYHREQLQREIDFLSKATDTDFFKVLFAEEDLGVVQAAK